MEQSTKYIAKDGFLPDSEKEKKNGSRYYYARMPPKLLKDSPPLGPPPPTGREARVPTTRVAAGDWLASDSQAAPPWALCLLTFNCTYRICVVVFDVVLRLYVRPGSRRTSVPGLAPKPLVVLSWATFGLNDF